VPDRDANLWIDYEYDKLGRLTAEVGQSAVDATQYYRLYNYDKVGNRTVMALYGADSGWTRWWMDYNDRNEMTKRYDAFDQYDWTGGMNRWSYDYDANGNLTQAKKEEKVEGNWTETLIWDYTWNVRNEMTSASKTENGNYAGKVEYGYSLIQAGARTERIQYDASNNVASWKRYEVDGLLTYRVDERYDSDEDGLDSGDPWRVIEKRTYGPGLIGNLLFKEVLKYPDPTSDGNPDNRAYYYGYDAVGNVILITEEYCGGTAYKYCFHQDAFGNELQEGWFESDSWSEAEDYGILEHQTGKEYDSFTGLYYYHFRWYDPVVGRFTSRTPLAPWEESAYLYCENNPLCLVDTNGLRPTYSWYARDDIYSIGPYVRHIIPTQEDIFGSLAGARARDWYAEYVVNNNVPPWRSRMWYLGLAASLWTPETYVDTSLTLVPLPIPAGRYLNRPFWNYYPAEAVWENRGWLTRGWGWKPPYALGEEAIRALNLTDNAATCVKKIKVPWWKPVWGPRHPRPIGDITTYGWDMVEFQEILGILVLQH